LVSGSGLQFEESGTHAFKGLAESVPVFRFVE